MRVKGTVTMRAHHAHHATDLYDAEPDLLPALWLAPEPGWGLPAHDILQLPRIFSSLNCFVWVIGIGSLGSERVREKKRIFGYESPALRRAVVHKAEFTIGGDHKFLDVAKVDTEEAAHELAGVTRSNTFGESSGLFMSSAPAPTVPAPIVDLLSLKAGRRPDDTDERRDERNRECRRLLRAYIDASRARGEVPLLVLDDCDLRQFYVAPVGKTEVDLDRVEQVPAEEHLRWLERGMRVRLCS
jgi:hypothetical protein